MDRRTVQVSSKDVVLYTTVLNPDGTTTIHSGHGHTGETPVEKLRRELKEAENRERRLRGQQEGNKKNDNSSGGATN